MALEEFEGEDFDGWCCLNGLLWSNVRRGSICWRDCPGYNRLAGDGDWKV